MTRIDVARYNSSSRPSDMLEVASSTDVATEARNVVSEGRSSGEGQWRERAVTADRAVQGIHRGDHVFVGSACATPRTLLRALEALSGFPAGVQLVHFLTDGAVVERDGRARSSFRHRAFYLGRDMLRLSSSDVSRPRDTRGGGAAHS